MPSGNCEPKMSSKVQTILAIDPGPEESAWVVMKGTAILNLALDANDEVLEFIIRHTYRLVIEDIRCYGMAVGQETFETCKWMGRFQQANDGQAVYIPRITVKTAICKTAKATDANIRQALIDRYGGSRMLAIGTKKHHGPLYSVKSHLWSALAVGVTYLEMQEAAR